MSWFVRWSVKGMLRDLLEDYAEHQVDELRTYLLKRGWVGEDGGLHIPEEDVARFIKDFLRGIIHVLHHG